MATTTTTDLLALVGDFLNGVSITDAEDRAALQRLAQQLTAPLAFAAKCSECGAYLRRQPDPVQQAALQITDDADTCGGLAECPVCSASCHDDQTIADHGRCYDCQKARQCGEVSEEEA